MGTSEKINRCVFDAFPEPVLQSAEGRLVYVNPAAVKVFGGAGRALTLGGELPGELEHLPQAGAGDAAVGASCFHVTVTALEDGRLFILRREAGTLMSDRRLTQFAQKARELMSDQMIAMQMLKSPRVTPENRERYLAVLNHSTYRLLRLVSNADYAGQMREEEELPQFPVIDLAGLCRQLGRQVESAAGAADWHFVCDVQVGSLLVRGDEDRLSRMILNLIANGGRAAGKGTVTLCLTQRGGRAVLTVFDSGTGMSEGELGMAFDPAEGVVGPENIGGGLGLGIPISQHIAALHKGFLTIGNCPGQGLTATVVLPLARPDRREQLKTSQTAYETGGGFSPVLVELSDVLPWQSYCTEGLD